MKLPHKRTLLLYIAILIGIIGLGVLYFLSLSSPPKGTLVRTPPKSCLYKISEFDRTRSMIPPSQDGVEEMRHGVQSRELYLSKYGCQTAELVCSDGSILVKLADSLLPSPFREITISGSILGSRESRVNTKSGDMGADRFSHRPPGVRDEDTEVSSEKISVPTAKSYIGYDRPLCRIFLERVKK